MDIIFAVVFTAIAVLVAVFKFTAHTKTINCPNCSEVFYTNTFYRYHWKNAGHGTAIVPGGFIRF